MNYPLPPQENRSPSGHLNAALDYLSKGWSVIPTNPRSKKPLIEWKIYQERYPTEQEVATWFERWPDAGIALVCGRVSGVVVLDVDGEVGKESFKGRHIPPAPTVKTGGNGFHYYFQHPGRPISGFVKKLPGLDLRADGNYAILPPSKHPIGNTYQWVDCLSPDDVEPAEMPAWLLELCTATKRDPVLEEEWLQPIPEGRRNSTLTRLAGSLFARKVPEDAVFHLILATNDKHCEPPLPEDEVIRLTTSVWQREVSERDTENLTSYYKKRAWEVRLEEINARDLLTQSTSGGLTYLPFLGAEGYIVKGWAHLLAGYPKSGKTELVVELINDWKDEKVLYLTEEPKSIWGQRLREQRRDWPHVNLVFAMGAGTKALVDRIEKGDESVVVVDTIRSLLSIPDESDNAAIVQQLSPLITTCRKKSRTLIFLHHDRKAPGEHGEAIAGGHGFLGLVDVALELRRDPSGVPNRRLLRGWGRIISIPEFVYEYKSASNQFVLLGSPKEVAIEAVKERLLAVLPSDEWLKTKDVTKALDEPKPSSEQTRKALDELFEENQVERDPKEARKGATYRWRLAVT